MFILNLLLIIFIIFSALAFIGGLNKSVELKHERGYKGKMGWILVTTLIYFFCLIAVNS